MPKTHWHTASSTVDETLLDDGARGTSSVGTWTASSAGGGYEGAVVEGGTLAHVHAVLVMLRRGGCDLYVSISMINETKRSIAGRAAGRAGWSRRAVRGRRKPSKNRRKPVVNRS